MGVGRWALGVWEMWFGVKAAQRSARGKTGKTGKAGHRGNSGWLERTGDWRLHWSFDCLFTRDEEETEVQCFLGLCKLCVISRKEKDKPGRSTPRSVPFSQFISLHLEVPLILMLVMLQKFQERQWVLHQEELEAPHIEGHDGQPILREYARLPALREPFFEEPDAQVVGSVDPHNKISNGECGRREAGSRVHNT